MLAHDEALCRRVVQSLEDVAIATADPQGLITGWNLGAERLFGYRSEELLGQPCARVFTPEDRERHAPEHLMATASTEGRITDERWYVRKDGSRLWARVVTTALRDEDGRLLGFVKVSRDLTDTKLTTDAVREQTARRADIIALQRELASEELEPDELMGFITGRVQALMRATGAVIALLEDDTLVFQVASGQAGAHQGARFRLDECLRGLSVRTSQAIKLDDSWADARREVEPLRHMGIRSLLVAPLFHHRRPIGVLELHSDAPNAFSDSDVEHLSFLAGFVASFLVRATERQRLQAVLKILPVGVTIADRSGQLIEANPAVYSLWGAGMPLGETTPERYDRFKAWWPRTGRRLGSHEWGLARAIEKGEVSGPEELEIETFTGEHKSILNYARPIRDATGRVTGAVSVAIDFTEQKREREKVLEANSRLDAAIHASGQLFFDWDPISDEIAFGGDVERVIGYSAEEMPGTLMQAIEVIHPEDRAHFITELEKARTEGTRLDLGFRILHKDGTVRHCWDTGCFYSGAGKGSPRMVGFVRDITERKRAEEMTLKLAREEAARTEAEAARRRMEALLAEQRRLTAILEATPDLVGTFDAAGRLLYLNRAGRRLLGLDEEQLTRTTLVDIHPEWAASLLLREGIPSAIREGSWSGETAVVRADGKELPTSQVLIAHRQPNGAVAYLSTIARDIAERKQVEEAQHFLSEASRTFAGTLERQAILDSLTRLAVSRLADCCITYWVGRDGKARPVAAHRDGDSGELLERLRALPPEGDQQQGISRVLRVGEPERVRDVTEAWLRAISRGEEHFRLLRELAPTSVMLVPLTFRERILGALFLASTRHERHYGPADLVLAEELASRAGLAIENARLYHASQRATRARDEVLAIVSHDLRNPLSTISMSGKLLLEKTPPEKTRERRQLEVIQRSAERMNRLIQDLLDVARMEAGHLSVERRREEVAPLVHDALELQRTLAEEKGIHLEEAVEKSLPAVSVDRERILQVLQNLMGNALRFTPEGGRISLRAWRVGPEVQLSVTDTGPGIAQESLPHLFEPFWQERRTEGAGLGLAIVKGIVEAHGGRIWVESQLGQGTTFVFTVPVSATAAPEEQPLPH